MKKKKFKRAVTLIEIMIVILLIGIVGGALAFNMKGSLNKGRAFKTEQNISRVKNILNMELAAGIESGSQIEKRWSTIVKESPLADGDKTLVDGWNQPLKVTFVGDEFEVESESPQMKKEAKKK